MSEKRDFDEWAFEQCVTKGHTIEAIKNEAGENIDWVNTTTKEHFNDRIEVYNKS